MLAMFLTTPVRGQGPLLQVKMPARHGNPLLCQIMSTRPVFPCRIRSMWRCARTIFVVLLALAFSAAANAQQLRIGYVDMKAVLDNAPQVVAGRIKLDQEFRERNDAIELDEMRADSLEQRLGQGDVDADNRIKLERDLREMHRSITRRKEDLRDELSFRRTEEVQSLEEQINVAVQEIAKRNGYDLIVSSPVIYASPDLDITDLILEQLEVEYAADQLELGNN